MNIMITDNGLIELYNRCEITVNKLESALGSDAAGS